MGEEDTHTHQAFQLSARKNSLEGGGVAALLHGGFPTLTLNNKKKDKRRE